MASAEIQIVNPANLLKIESFLNDTSYKEAIENSSTFNQRLCAERRLRMPFLDPQTGVAQNHCNLYMSKKQRMPGAREGQVYTYPAQRWRKARRQYLTTGTNRWGWPVRAEPPPPEVTGEDSSGAPGEVTGGEDSRDGSQPAASKDDSKEWFYDELTLEEIEGLDEPPEPEGDEDYFDDTYANRRKRRGVALTGPGSRGGRSRTRVSVPEDTPAKRGRAGRGRKRTTQGTLPYEVAGDAEKPYGCEQCGARYKTRPGLTYHYTHTHKDLAAASDGDSRDSSRAADAPARTTTPPVSAATTEYQDSYVTFLNNPAAAAAAAATAAATARRPTPPPRPASADTSSSDSTLVPAVQHTASADASPAPPPVAPPAVADPSGTVATDPDGTPSIEIKPTSVKVLPSPYCDFCLGTHSENKKTGIPEELVSCSDCGRSGHPTCLQFTDNMFVSVHKYCWQCIECKCCSVCGNSDNDAELLFCDDCDRGYHMYCLSPPLETPPEGSWSCALCIKEFHNNTMRQ